jgi:hypothetical protein
MIGSFLLQEKEKEKKEQENGTVRSPIIVQSRLAN